MHTFPFLPPGRNGRPNSGLLMRIEPASEAHSFASLHTVTPPARNLWSKSVAKACKKTLQNFEEAREELLNAVAILRGSSNICPRFAIKTAAALDRISEFVGFSPRRAHTIAYNQYIAKMDDKERHHICMGAFAVQRWFADYLRKCADEIDEKVDAREKLEKSRYHWRDDCQQDTSAKHVV